jgi:hypothetical protein
VIQIKPHLRSESDDRFVSQVKAHFLLYGDPPLDGDLILVSISKRLLVCSCQSLNEKSQPDLFEYPVHSTTFTEYDPHSGDYQQVDW